MIVIGAKGHAKEVLEILYQNGETQNLSFFDNVSNELSDQLFNQYPIIKSLDEARQILLQVDSFASAIGNPFLREKIVNKFMSIGGQYKTIVSCNAHVGNFDVEIGDGCNIMSNVFISNSVKIGRSCLINQGASIHHDVTIGNFCDISPNASILGRVSIGDFVSIGAGAILLPDILIEDNTIIGAGSVVNENVLKGQTVFGNPAKTKK